MKEEYSDFIVRIVLYQKVLMGRTGKKHRWEKTNTSLYVSTHIELLTVGAGKGRQNSFRSPLGLTGPSFTSDSKIALILENGSITKLYVEYNTKFILRIWGHPKPL